jgi:hypothetical protein
MGTLDRMRLARQASLLNERARTELPPLVLMTDDERLPDPVAAARLLPRGSMVIVRARQSSHRAKLAALLRPITRAGGSGFWSPTIRNARSASGPTACIWPKEMPAPRPAFACGTRIG